MNDLSIAELKSEIEQSNYLLSKADKEIENLQSQAKFPGIRQQYKMYKNILVQNHKLSKEHQKNAFDIKDYKNQMNELQKKLQQNKNTILALYQENQNLKMKHQLNKQQNLPKKKIRGAADLRQSFGLNLIKHEKKENQNYNYNQYRQYVVKEEENDDEGPLPQETKKIEFDKLQKKRFEKQETFKQYQQIIIKYSKDLGALKILM